MGGSSKSQTVGYKYKLGVDAKWCHSPVDAVTRISFDDRVAWSGYSTGGQINIDKPNLFGGKSREGGVGGAIDIEMGAPDQAPNDYIQGLTGQTLIPAFRGVLGTVFRNFYWGNNPYLKKFSIRAQRVNVLDGGDEQWYIEKAPIRDESLISGSTSWKYFVTDISNTADYSSKSYDDSSWPDGNAPFISQSVFSAAGIPVQPSDVGFSHAAGTVVPIDKKVWLRKTITLSKVPDSLRLQAFIDNAARIYINGALFQQIGDYVGTYGFNELFVDSGNLQVGDNLVAVEVIDDEVSGDGDQMYFDWRLEPFDFVDLNAIHIIRESLTNKNWGMRVPPEMLDDTDFRANADILYEEGLGLSLIWDKSKPAGDFINDVLRHINALQPYIDRRTGKIKLTLLRGDYDKPSLPIFDKTNIIRVEDYERPGVGQLVNTLVVKYRDSAKSKEASFTISDPALVQISGGVVSETVNYPGFSHYSVARKAGLRDLRALSTRLRSCTLYVNRAGASLRPGSVFRMTWPDLQIDDVVMRVVSIKYGVGADQQVKLTVAEDVYDFDPTVVPSVDEPTYVPILTGSIAPVLNRLSFEQPYFELVKQIGEADTENKLMAIPEIGYLGAVAANPSNLLNAELQVDSGLGYESQGIVDFCPTVTLSSELNRTDTVFSFVNGVDVDEIELGSIAQIDNEIFRVDAIDEDLGTITVGRGVLDTVPENHDSASIMYFWDNYSASDSREYIESASVDVKLLPNSGSDQLDIADAPADTVIFSSRANRPYPPGKLTVNSDYFPEAITGEVLFDWAHRDRLQQTSAALNDFLDGDIGPEDGTAYTIRVYGESDELGSENAGITGKTFTYENSQELSDFNYTSGTVLGDPDFSSVVSLLHFNGLDASTVFTDQAGLTTWSVTNTTAEIDTEFSRFGESLLLNNGGIVTAATPGAINLGLGDFTVEFFFRLNVDSGTTTYRTILTIGGAWGDLSIRFGDSGFGTRLQCGIKTGTLAGTYSTAYDQYDFDDGEWRHIALVRESGQVYFYIDGIMQTVRNNNYSGTPVTSFSDSSDLSSPTSVVIGAGAPNSLLGGLDDLRMSAVSRYSGNFTPTVTAFPDSTSPTDALRLSSRLRFEVESVRDGFTSFQKHDITVDRAGWDFHFNKYFDGGI